MTAKAHYDNHLGYIYSWMAGDFKTKSDEFKKFLGDNAIIPISNKIAIDLGAGHGIQSIPLAEAGFQVIAVDFNQQLLDELKSNAESSKITIINDDIKNVAQFADKAELIVCCGDTLSHLETKAEVREFIAAISTTLDHKGKVMLSFRDYANALTGANRFIPVKSDSKRILTCMLEYADESVYVTDLFHEKTNDGWKQKVSTYKKVRLLTNEVIEYLETQQLSIEFNRLINGLTTIIARKK